MKEITINDITPSFLKSSAYTEHVAHWERIGETVDLSSLSLLEYGCGYSTKWFLDNFKHVVSAELVSAGSGPAWLFECEKLYENYTNWSPLLVYLPAAGSDPVELKRAFPQLGVLDERPVETCGVIPNIYNGPHSQDPRNGPYFEHSSACVNKFSELHFKGQIFDMAFIDHGTSILRGPCVQSCIDNDIDIIICHDMGHGNFDKDNPISVNREYNYHQIKHDPKKYKFLRTLKGMGSGFWVKKIPKYESLIENLSEYV